MPDRRQADIDCFYELLDLLCKRVDGYRCLQDDNWNAGLPDRGVYFFFEEGETRARSTELRVVRVGTVRTGALRSRLRQHRRDKGSSAFRWRVGHAIGGQRGISVSDLPYRDKKDVFKTYLAKPISEYIQSMPFLPVSVDYQRDRAYIERNATALLSDYYDQAIDKPSEDWLGRYSTEEKVCRSGLWSKDYVTTPCYNPAFLETLEKWIDCTDPAA